ncbi:hypothetical protein N0V90_012801 [Kalmusia sp. IMI 367209]|nr:hypothetical protein N0V90_012801 [Kalmusia sp. IMI 367209]
MLLHAAAITSSLLPLLLSLPLASAKCYKDTIQNADTQFALDHVYDTAAFLQGNLANGQQRGLCVSDTSVGNQWYFGIHNGKDTATDVTKEDIDKYLRRELNGCGKNGGHRDEDDVTFIADPGNGICVDSVYIGQHPRQRRKVASQGGKVIFIPISGGPVPTRPE